MVRHLKAVLFSFKKFFRAPVKNEGNFSTVELLLLSNNKKPAKESFSQNIMLIFLQKR